MSPERMRFWFMVAALIGMLASETDSFTWPPIGLVARAQEIADEALKRFLQTGGWEDDS